jgi:hypothetical protein
MQASSGTFSEGRSSTSLRSRQYRQDVQPDHYKAHDAFHRCLAKLTLDDVKAAIRRAETITRNTERDGKTLLQHKDYKYYRDNPALSINEAVKQMLAECGVL